MPNLSPNNVAHLIAQECDGIKTLLLQKNEAYGNSALDPVRIFSKSPSDEQIRVRIDDKLSRLARGQAAGEDVELDLIGYFILLRVNRAMNRPQSVPAPASKEPPMPEVARYEPELQTDPLIRKSTIGSGKRPDDFASKSKEIFPKH